MDSTLIQSHNNNLSASKLPIKRKTPDPIDADEPPFKFHRIWTESDEIRFLQGLLDCSSQNLAFPRDLGIFYAQFSGTMSQPYTKSQLSEKLRRLRKKFRVVSTRLSKGMDRSQLSLHDRALYDLSKKLWHPEFAATSPFSGRNVGMNHCNDNDDDGKSKKSSLVGVKVEFAPTLPGLMSGFVEENGDGGLGGMCDEDKGEDEGRLREVNVEFEEEEGGVGNGGGDDDALKVEDRENGIGEVVAKVVINVFDECLKEVTRLASGGGGGGGGVAEGFHARCQQQRIDELNVLGSRLRLVMEHSLTNKLSTD